MIWDETYHEPAAQSYLTGEKREYRNRRNPPLGKELIALSIQVLGESHFAYRLPSALAAAAIGALLFLTGLWLSSRWEAGMLALLLWLSSTLALLHARLAMLDMLTALFFFAGLAAFLPAMRRTGRKNIWLHLACLFAALGGMVKTIDFLLFPIFFLGLIAARSQWPLRRSLPQLLGATLWTLALSFLLSYGLLGYQVREIPREFRYMFLLQSYQHADFPGLSPWYAWFLGKGELWYRSKPGPDGWSFAALCIQNPILFTGGALASLVLLIRALRKKQAIDWVLGVAVPAQLLFWLALKGQTIVTYALPMVPIFCLNTAYALSLGLQRPLHYRLWGACLAAASLLFFWQLFPAVLGSFIP